MKTTFTFLLMDVCHLLLNMYISRASNFHDFRDLSKITKLNTGYTRIFGTAHHREFIGIEYQHFRDMICNILAIM